MMAKELSKATAGRILQEIKFRGQAEKLTDGELARAMIEEIWTRLPLWTWHAVLIDEAITRLKRADTRQRWQERKERRKAQQSEEKK